MGGGLSPDLLEVEDMNYTTVLNLAARSNLGTPHLTGSGRKVTLKDWFSCTSQIRKH